MRTDGIQDRARLCGSCPRTPADSRACSPEAVPPPLLQGGGPSGLRQVPRLSASDCRVSNAPAELSGTATKIITIPPDSRDARQSMHCMSDSRWTAKGTAPPRREPAFGDELWLRKVQRQSRNALRNRRKTPHSTVGRDLRLRALIPGSTSTSLVTNTSK